MEKKPFLKFYEKKLEGNPNQNKELCNEIQRRISTEIKTEYNQTTDNPTNGNIEEKYIRGMVKVESSKIEQNCLKEKVKSIRKELNNSDDVLKDLLSQETKLINDKNQIQIALDKLENTATKFEEQIKDDLSLIVDTNGYSDIDLKLESLKKSENHKKETIRYTMKKSIENKMQNDREQIQKVLKLKNELEEFIELEKSIKEDIKSCIQNIELFTENIQKILLDERYESLEECKEKLNERIENMKKNLKTTKQQKQK